ncbi:hypothetical protein Acy02nite_26200 [Actinoplanes cyaneus]|uniref:Mycothiol-dependent maleylpyruvate isomerase metal-binding domain-containing protein n=1 Tax=Actinoplanes cyaneus TaxID=52696 RepID=A0A919IFJ9_9ACTN|nr:hypothetical protein [Actinoplanes cyaneus]MCW2138052.1 hypothetical protein [Actinoplanes cyaneus]GID64739.1 hypothetical protein Acy02nite_26200 [Actinoplanes cyaneus]
MPEPSRMIEESVSHALRLAQSWTGWDGTPIPADDRVYTPHKAIRRITDHLIDHLAEVEARLAGVPTIPDHWHASAITTPGDLAPFTKEDLAEATSRLTRLAQIWTVRLESLTEQQWDQATLGAWTIREIVEHLADTYYADAVGNLASTPG